MHLIRSATDGCRSRPWLAGQLPDVTSHCRYFQTLALFFSSVFDNWSRASKYIYTAETLVFTNCDYC